ncbi:MAG: 2-octaprenyl-6-methoxyphenyl hydroxylase [Pseudohongiellaceae bacterium]
MPLTEQRYDVVIIGGGLVGASAALMLRRQLPDHASLLVVEATGHRVSPQGGPEFAPDFDVRTTALSQGSQQLYERLGLWPGLAPDATPIHTIHVSDRSHMGAVTLDRADAGVDALGQVVENRCLGTTLLKAVMAEEGITWLAPAVTGKITPVPSGMRLSVRTGETSSEEGAGEEGESGETEERHIEAGLVILADGGRSTLCGQLGITQQCTEYDQQAVVANVGFRQPHENRAFERFTDTGPLALLPLSSWEGMARAALIWTQPREQAGELLAMPESDFLEALQQRFGHRLGTFLQCGQRHGFPLQLTQAREQIRPGLVLLGNVAHTLHPVAGQGLNLALRDAAALAETVGRAMEAGRSPGKMSVLQEYNAQRQQDQQRTIAFSHHLVGLFSGAGVMKRWTRRFGLFSIDLLPPVRRPFVRAAMGLTGR